MLVFPVLTEIAAERIWDPSGDVRWAVVYDVQAQSLLGEGSEELWALPRAQLNQLWDALMASPQAQRNLHPCISAMYGKLRVRSPLFEETDQRFLDWNGTPIGLIQERLDLEAAADELYSFLRSRKELLTADIHSSLDFDLLSEGDTEALEYYTENYNLIQEILPAMVYVDQSDIDDWEWEISVSRERDAGKKTVKRQSVLRKVNERYKRVSFNTFVHRIEIDFDAWMSDYTNRPDNIGLRITWDSIPPQDIGKFRIAELTSHCVRLRLYDLGLRVRVVPVVPELVEDWIMVMSVANAERIALALTWIPQWKRDWFGRKSLVLGGHEFRVRHRELRGTRCGGSRENG